MTNIKASRVITIAFLYLLIADPNVYAKTAASTEVCEAIGNNCDVKALEKADKAVRSAIEKIASYIKSLCKGYTDVLDKSKYKEQFSPFDATATGEILAVYEGFFWEEEKRIGVYKVIDSQNDQDTIAGVKEIMRNAFVALCSAKQKKVLDKVKPLNEALVQKGLHIYAAASALERNVLALAERLEKSNGFVLFSDCGKNAEKIKKDAQKIFKKQAKFEKDIAELIKNLVAVIKLQENALSNININNALLSSVQRHVSIFYYLITYFSLLALVTKYISDNFIINPDALKESLRKLNYVK